MYENINLSKVYCALSITEALKRDFEILCFIFISSRNDDTVLLLNSDPLKQNIL